MGSKSQKVPKTQTQVSEVRFPQEIRPFVPGAAQALSSAFGQAVPFGPSTVPGFTQDELAAQRTLRGVAGQTNPLFGASEEALASILAGPGGPAQQAFEQSIVDRVLPQVSSQFRSGAALGLPAAADAISSALARESFIPQRQLQLQAAGVAPQLADAEQLRAAQLLSGIGGEQRALQQAQLLEEQARVRFPVEEAQRRALGQFSALVGAPTGSAVTAREQQQLYSNPLLTGLGTGLGAATTAAALGAGGPLTAGLGILGFGLGLL